MSRPKASVPKRYLSLPPISQAGGSSLSRNVWSIGEYGASSGANSAMTTIADMMAIGIHGTRAARRAPASRRAGQSKRHNRRRGLGSAGRAEGGRSAMAMAGASHSFGFKRIRPSPPTKWGEREGPARSAGG
jgi:hypothetical protein